MRAAGLVLLLFSYVKLLSDRYEDLIRHDPKEISSSELFMLSSLGLSR